MHSKDQLKMSIGYLLNSDINARYNTCEMDIIKKAGSYEDIQATALMENQQLTQAVNHP